MRVFFGPAASLATNPSAIDQKIKWSTVRRTLKEAVPHSRALLLFLVVVVVSSSIGIAYPLIYRHIINEGILKQNTALIVRLAFLIAGLGITDAALGLAQTYLATHTGAGVVLSLRSRLFDHIQRIPLAPGTT